jgi:hypothetical protein
MLNICLSAAVVVVADMWQQVRLAAVVLAVL